MALRFLALRFADPSALGPELAQVLAGHPLPTYTIALRSGSSADRPCIRIAGPERSPGAVTVADRLAGFCHSRGLPVALDLAPPGPDAPSGGTPVLELIPPRAAATAERFGAVVREFLDRSPEPAGALAVLDPAAAEAVTAAVRDPVVAPLPASTDPAWGCAVYLLRGIELVDSGGGVVWRT